MRDLPGIGEDIAGYIEEIVDTGERARLRRLAGDIPVGLLDIMDLPGVGPKTTRRLWRELGVESIDDLADAAREGKIEKLDGFREKTQSKIVEGIEASRTRGDRMPLGDADSYVEPLVQYMRDAAGLGRLEVAGSYRRRKETVGDIDLLAVAEDNAVTAPRSPTSRAPKTTRPLCAGRPSNADCASPNTASSGSKMTTGTTTTGRIPTPER